MHHLLRFALAQFPAFYCRLLRLRATPNLEKIAFLQLVRKDDIVLDVGANTGYYTRLFSNLAGRRGKVHAFEPVAESFAALRTTIARGCVYRNVVLNNTALGEVAGPAEMFGPAGDLAQAALVRHTRGSWSNGRGVERMQCQVDTLDEYASRNSLQRLDFLKCDVEGAELQVLRGGTATVRALRPLLHLEVFAPWAKAFGYEPMDLVRYVEGLGYRDFLLLSEYGRVLSISELDAFAQEARESANLLCAPPDRTASLTHLRRRLTATAPA